MSGTPIGNNLRRLRFEHGEMSQDALARAVGITRQTIVALEGGHYGPSLELAMKLARVFGRSVDEVFFWRDEA
jgi:putative transcriptional regulator